RSEHATDQYLTAILAGGTEIHRGRHTEANRPRAGSLYDNLAVPSAALLQLGPRLVIKHGEGLHGEDVKNRQAFRTTHAEELAGGRIQVEEPPPRVADAHNIVGPLEEREHCGHHL